MHPEQFRQVHRIAEDPVGLTGQRLVLFLDEQCTNHPPAVRVAVEALLDRLAGQPHHIPEALAATEAEVDFDLQERIGSGSSADVYKARQRSLDRFVALKVFHQSHQHNVTSTERFRTEAWAVARLSHPAIVPIFETGLINGQHYIAYALIEGRTLAESVCEGPLPPVPAARIVQTLADGVAHAHAREIVHRDLKPANILLNSDNEVLITDFGVARLLNKDSELTETDQLIGTPSFMSPEQVDQKFGSIGKPSDIYSLGGILYFLLSGRPPAAGATVQQTLRSTTDEPPPDLRAAVPELDKDLETIVRMCLAKEPFYRYASAELLAEDLRAYVEGRPVLARPVGKLTRCFRWCLRHRGLASLIGSLIVAVPAMLIAGLLALNQAGEATRARATAHANLKVAQSEAQRARRSSYVSRMIAAQQALDLKQTQRCRRMLLSLIPGPGEEDLRGFDWRCMWHLVHSELTAFQEHPGIVTDLQFSPTGDSLATTGVDNCIRFWDTASGRLKGTIEQQSTDYSCLAFIPGTDRIASTDQRVVRIWNTENHSLLAQMEGHTGRIMALSVSNDASRLATAAGAGDHRVGLWDLHKNSLTAFLDGHQMGVRDVAFSPDGK